MLIDAKTMRFAAVLSSTVMVKALIIVGSIWLGNHLDKRFHTSPLLMFLFLVIGTSVGFVWLFHNIKRLKPKDEGEK